MRFGRSTRTLAAVGRRLLGDKPEGEHEGIASDERSALLNAAGGDPAMEYTEVVTPVPTGGDPTQRLLTALGRFQRQVNKADSGAPQHQWADECMEQLIEGISIAHENNWHDVKEALTDTARILQSYEDAAVAQQAVAFLQDAYEILCLMVGDIIVDNVRSGVMNKWRQRYHQALDDLARHGVSLVDDEGEEPAAQPDNIVRFEQPAQVIDRAFPFGDPDAEELTAEEGDDTEKDEAAPTLEVGDTLSEEYTEAAEALTFEEDAAEVEGEAEEDSEDEDLDELEAAEAESELETEEENDTEEETDAEVEAEEDAAAEEEITAEEEEVAAELPPLDEVLFEEPTPTPAPSNIHRLGAAAPQAAPAAEATGELFDTPVQTPRVMEAAPAAVRDPDEDVQGMLRTAQQAMSRGDVANAKVMALQVAVKMAELEVSRAKDTLRVVEGRLEDTQRSIETASEAVRRTEAGVADVEEQIGQREGEFQQKRDHIAGLRDHMGTVQGVIEDIDEQIRALQERRAAEERNIAFLQDQLEQSLAAESRIQTDLDMLAQEEEAAREALDAAKQRVRDLQRERLARESEINDSRHTLMHQERSVEDIQRTLQQVLHGGEEPPAESGLLF